MRLGFNTNGLRDHRLDEGLRLLADLGFEAVALTLDVGHLDPFRCHAHEVDRIAALLEKLHLHPVIETGARFLLDPRNKHEPTLMSRGAEARRLRLEFYRRCAAIGCSLGAEVVSFWAGVDHEPGPDSAERLRSGVALACQTIRDQELLPALEPEPGMAVETLAEFSELAAVLGAEAPRLCLDVGHLYVTQEGDPAALIAAHASLAAQVHLADMRRGVHEHLLPGQGDVDFQGVLSALAAAAYGGPVCFELSRSSHQAPEALARCLATWGAVRS